MTCRWTGRAPAWKVGGGDIRRRREAVWLPLVAAPVCYTLARAGVRGAVPVEFGVVAPGAGGWARLGVVERSARVSRVDMFVDAMERACRWDEVCFILLWSARRSSYTLRSG